MTRGRWAVLVAAVVAAGLIVPADADRPAFEVRGSVGGGVTDLDTGRTYQSRPEPERSSARGAVHVVPFREGARLRIPVTLDLADGAGEVRVTDIRYEPGPNSVAHPAGAVVGEHCCTLDGATEFRPFTVDRRLGEVIVGVDVVLCCAPRPGWTERLRGIVVTYEQGGLPRTYRKPFPDIQTVVVRA